MEKSGCEFRNGLVDQKQRAWFLMENKKSLINFLLTVGIAVACVLGWSNANSDNKNNPAKDKPADSGPASISI